MSDADARQWRACPTSSSAPSASPSSEAGPADTRPRSTGAQLGAEVTLVERAGVGGSAVLTDVVPSKTLIATAEAATAVGEAADLGVQFFTRSDGGRAVRPEVAVNLAAVNQRLLLLARQQSEDMKSQLIKAGVRIVAGDGRLDGPNRLVVSTGKGKKRHRLRRDRRRHARRRGRARARASCRPRSPTASASSPGPSSTRSTRCPST